MKQPATVLAVVAASLTVSGCASVLSVAQFVDSTAIALSGLIPPSRVQPVAAPADSAAAQACPTPARDSRAESPREYCPVDHTDSRIIKLQRGGSLVIRNTSEIGSDAGNGVVAHAVDISR